MALTYKSRVRCTTNTSGVGSYTIEAAVDASHQSFSAIGSGQRCSYVCTDGQDYEEGIGTVTVSGGVTLTRDEIVSSTNGNAAVDWLTSGAKDIWVDLLAAHLVSTQRTQTFEEPQNMGGEELRLSPDNAVVLEASNSQATLDVGANAALTMTTAAVTRIRYTDAGSGAGPTFELARISSTPAANDPIGRMDLVGRDSAGNEHIYAAIRGVIADPTSGSEDGTLKITTSIGGSQTDYLTLEPNLLVIADSTNVVMGGKTSIDADSDGVELRASGLIAVRAGSGTALVVGRDDDGTLVSLRVNSVQQGAISVSGATVTYGAFSGSHFADWGQGWVPKGWPEVEPPLGTLLCAVDEDYRAIDGTHERLPMVRPSDRQGDPAVYGLYGGTMKEKVWLPLGELDRILKSRPWLGASIVRRQIVEQEGRETVIRRRVVDTGKRVPVEHLVDTGKRDPFGRPIRRKVHLAEPVLEERDVPERVRRQVELVTFRRILVSGLGMAPAGVLVAGPCRMGDLLWASDKLGLAEVAPPGAQANQILGKAFGNKKSAKAGLVRAALWAS